MNSMNRLNVLPEFRIIRHGYQSHFDPLEKYLIAHARILARPVRFRIF